MKYIHKLKFSDQKESDEILFPEEKPIWMEGVETIVQIGTICKPATLDEQNIELTASEIIPGWHVDVLSNGLIQELVPYCLDHPPTNPVHGYGWAGDEYTLVICQPSNN